jgi:WNK lysine deficient protein kinase
MEEKSLVSLGAMEEPSEDVEPPEQPVVERDPSGRWSRVRTPGDAQRDLPLLAAYAPVQAVSVGCCAQVDQILGRGAFKTVYKGFDEEEGMEVAWNQVRVCELVSSKEERERLFAEIRVLKQLKHKNIMTFYDSWLDPKTHTVNFITELFTSGTLRQYAPRSRARLLERC